VSNSELAAYTLLAFNARITMTQKLCNHGNLQNNKHTEAADETSRFYRLPPRTAMTLVKRQELWLPS
jgi:hypothetical protein